MSSAPWTSTILQKPQTPSIFSLLPLPPSRSIQFYRLNHNLTVKPLNSSSQSLYGSLSSARPQDEDEDEEGPVIGDCLVFEEGIFNDPFVENARSSRKSGANTTRANADKGVDVSPENLIPEDWLDVQEELNITKKERRRMARELEYGRAVDKRRQALMPLNSEESERIKQEKFEKIRQEKIKQLSPVVLDNPKKAYFRDYGATEKREKETSGEVSGGRVAPRNPRLAVYGGGLEDVSAFFSSGKYESSAAEKSQGIFLLLNVWFHVESAHEDWFCEGIRLLFRSRI